MNILQVTLGFYPASGWGGPVKIVHQNSRELIRRGHQVTVICTNLLSKTEVVADGTFSRMIDGIRVVYFRTWRIPWWPGTVGPIWLPDLQRFLREELESFDIVHLNGYRNLMLLPVARAADAADIPVVMQPHGAIPVIVNSHLVKRLYDRLLGQQELRGLRAVIALQESERDQARRLGIAQELIEVVPNGLEPLAVAARPRPGHFRRQHGIDPETSLILFLGRINRKKGTDMLVHAFARLTERMDAQLAIVGPDDGQLSEVQTLVHEYGLADRVVIPGILHGDDVLSAFQDANLFVLPCRADTFPVTIMEACQMGTPMVVTDRCEIAHLIEGRVADIVPFEATLFADAMLALLADEERYRRMQEECTAIMADTFSVQAVVDKIEALYERVNRET